MSWQYDGRCLVCGGRGQYPTAPHHITWVPWTTCGHCDGTGFDPYAATFASVLNK